ncbi:MAG TPA: anthranilate phosphoribosyltransferase [Xanthomonadales bacterium]|nr:anthranilate phosphoribosyltransferase [Xanthomonadales bacterium]
MDIKAALARVADRQDLGLEEMRDVMAQIMTGAASDAQIGAFLMGLRMKGESLDEITAAVTVMRELASPVEIAGEHLVDIVGTGGDGANLFNVSTAASFVVAAAGGHVAKHGNRSVSSSSGSADVLEAAGVTLGLEPGQVKACVEKIGVGFMFAPAHHSAMRHAIGPRREMGLRTVFNILGPMTNPAGVRRLLIGVYDQALCRPVAEVLMRLGAEHVLVVHSADGLDEISAAAPTYLVEGSRAGIKEYEVTPQELGLPLTPLDGLEVGSALESLELIRMALSGAPGDRAERARRVVALNAGAALYVAGLQDSLAKGVAAAAALLQTGKPWLKVEALADFTAAL